MTALFFFLLMVFVVLFNALTGDGHSGWQLVVCCLGSFSAGLWFSTLFHQLMRTRP